jgi:hypothetical protein
LYCYIGRVERNSRKKVWHTEKLTNIQRKKKMGKGKKMTMGEFLGSSPVETLPTAPKERAEGDDGWLWWGSRWRL